MNTLFHVGRLITLARLRRVIFMLMVSLFVLVLANLGTYLAPA
ncbi:MAG: hypothetical protein AAFP20_10220 [Cyanobacteria bacterium J06614_10]